MIWTSQTGIFVWDENGLATISTPVYGFNTVAGPMEFDSTHSGDYPTIIYPTNLSQGVKEQSLYLWPIWRSVIPNFRDHILEISIRTTNFASRRDKCTHKAFSCL